MGGVEEEEIKVGRGVFNLNPKHVFRFPKHCAECQRTRREIRSGFEELVHRLVTDTSGRMRLGRQKGWRPGREGS